MKTRTAVVLVALAVLLLAVPFAVLTWAFGGTSGLLAFLVPLVVLLALAAALSRLVSRSSGGDGTR